MAGDIKGPHLPPRVAGTPGGVGGTPQQPGRPHDNKAVKPSGTRATNANLPAATRRSSVNASRSTTSSKPTAATEPMEMFVPVFAADGKEGVSQRQPELAVSRDKREPQQAPQLDHKYPESNLQSAANFIGKHLMTILQVVSTAGAMGQKQTAASDAKPATTASKPNFTALMNKAGVPLGRYSPAGQSAGASAAMQGAAQLLGFMMKKAPPLKTN